MLDGYKVSQACAAVRRLRAVDIGDTNDPTLATDESIQMLREMVGYPDPAKRDPVKAGTCEWTYTHEAQLGVPNYKTCRMVYAEMHGPYCPDCGRLIVVKKETP
ncbi:MAG: hypothetical protein PHX83_07075 [Acidobacteriia bacterium]|nr:hypothetical protein [Terriglobia bacterium]